MKVRDNDDHSEILNGIASNFTDPAQIYAQAIRRNAAAEGVSDSDRSNWTQVQEQVFQIWAELLGASSFGLDDDFLSLGGHSVLGMQVLSRVQARFGLELPIDVMFEQELTVRRLADRVEHWQANPSGSDT